MADTDLITHKNGLNFAFAFTDGFKPERMLDPTYGSIQVYSYSWGYDENGRPFDKKDYKELHDCSEEELGLVEGSGKSQFFKQDKSSEKIVKFHKKQFLCMN